MIANLALAAVLAASAASVSPDTRYDPAIPTLEQVTGHAAGTRISTPAQMAAYVEALGEAAPDRTEPVNYVREILNRYNAYLESTELIGQNRASL